MAPDLDAPPRMAGRGLPALVYCVCLLGALFVFFSYDPTGLWLALTIAVPVAALAWLVVAARRYQRETGCAASPAARAYRRRFFPMMMLYVVILLAAVWVDKHYLPAGPLAVVLAILPALPLIGVVWVFGRLLVEEKDEYLRNQTARQFIIATGFMLSVTSVWGFLDAFDQVPHMPMYWAFIIWCFGLAVGTVVNETRS
jgi:uncharacterized membrane protein